MIDDEKYYAHTNVSHYNKDIKLVYNYADWKKLIVSYCFQDCRVLFDILVTFKTLVYFKWQINIEDYP